MATSAAQMQALLRLGQIGTRVARNWAPASYQSPLNTVGNEFGEAGNGLGIYSGLSQGTLPGYLSAGANAAQLGARSGYFSPETSSELGGVGNDLGSALGVYTGLERGGFSGDTQAAIDAARLGLQTGVQSGAMSAAAASPYTSALGYAAIPLALYNEIEGYQSGNTGSDALSGAETGAAIGSVVPGIGTVIGGLVGGAAGALSSAFGAGEEDPENANWNQYASAYDKNPNVQNYITPAQAYQNLAGVMDAKDNSAGHSEPIEQVFGRMGEQNLMDQMTNYVNQQYNSGAIKPGESISDQWNQTVDPWLQSKGATINPNQNTVTGAPEGSALIGDLQGLLGDWESGELTPQSQVGSGGQTISGLSAFSGETPQEQAYWQQQAADQAKSIRANEAFERQQQARANHATLNVASGGSMKKSKLHGIYEGSYADRIPGFADGGSSYYSSYNSAPTDSGIWSDASIYNDQPQTSALGTIDYSLDPSNPYGSYSDSSGTGFDATGADTSAANSTGAGSGSSSGNGSWLSGLLGAGSGAGSTLAQLAKSYGWLLPLIGAATGATNSKQATPPSQPAGFSTGPSQPYSTPNLSRQRTQFPSDTDWYTYGEHPEQQFFQNNQLPYVQGFSPAAQAPGNSTPRAVMAEGGALDFASGSGQNYVQGPGDGTSDDIPAKLSDGEYVIDAGTVSMLGNGSNEAGARRLDMLRENVRRHAGKQLVRGKQFMKAKAPEEYLPPAGYKPREGQE